MQVFWFLAIGCLTVSAIPLEGENVQLDGEATKVNSEAFTTSSYESEENHINGVNGWYLPQKDGSLQWMDMETIEEVKYNSSNRGIINPFKKVKFHLYSALSPDNSEEISTKPIDIETSGFNADHPTVICAHGFLQNKYAFSLNKFLRDALFKKGPLNFIYVEWADALTFNYIHSSSMVPIVGQLTANLFETLVKNYNMDCQKTHLIGHSLGAHVAGFAAKNIKSCKVPLITALDPALPLFPYDKPDNRLNNTDATHVVSIQTDGGVYGQVEPVGTVTYYCNGGQKQPGCLPVMYNVCCHERSVYYYTEAIEKDNFPAKKCNNYLDAVNNRCSSEFSEVFMGDDSKHLTASGIYYVETNSSPPYGLLKPSGRNTLT